MTSYCCVSYRDINRFITVIVSNLNNNNFWVILFYKTLIAKNLTVLFHSFFYFTTPILFLNQIKFIQYGFKKKHYQSFEYPDEFEKIWNKKPIWLLLRI